MFHEVAGITFNILLRLVNEAMRRMRPMSRPRPESMTSRPRPKKFM